MTIERLTRHDLAHMQHGAVLMIHTLDGRPLQRVHFVSAHFDPDTVTVVTRLNGTIRHYSTDAYAIYGTRPTRTTNTLTIGLLTATLIAATLAIALIATGVIQ